MTRRHHIDDRRVFLDLETGGTKPWLHPITQFALIAYTKDWVERERLEVKVLFDEVDCDAEALKKNHYDRALWAKHAVSPLTAHNRVSYFLREHATVENYSERTEAKYYHAQLFAHNAAFDADFLWSWNRRLKGEHPEENLYLPAQYQVICTYQAALRFFDVNYQFPKPVNYKLGTLCEHFGIPFSVNESHDALYDAQKSAELYQVMERLEFGDETLQEAA